MGNIYNKKNLLIEKLVNDGFQFHSEENEIDFYTLNDGKINISIEVEGDDIILEISGKRNLLSTEYFISMRCSDRNFDFDIILKELYLSLMIRAF